MYTFYKIQFILIFLSVWSVWGQVPSNLDLLQVMVSRPVLEAVDSLSPTPEGS